MNDEPDMMSDLHQTAREWFALKVTKGEIPQTILGHGELDGLEYFVVDMDGVTYWLTDVGLFTPPNS